MNYVRYYVETEDGEPVGLSRVRRDENGIFGENFLRGQWVDAPRVVSLAMDPLWADQVSEAEAERIMKRLGG